MDVVVSKFLFTLFSVVYVLVVVHDLLTGAGRARHVTHAGGVLVVAAHAGHLGWHTGLGRHTRAWAGHHGCHHWGAAGSHVVHAGSGNAGAHLVLVHDELAAALGSLSALEAGLGGPHHCLVLTEESLGLGNGSDGVVTSGLLGESHLSHLLHSHARNALHVL